MKNQTSKLNDTTAFYLGFDFASECIVEVLSDPLGDHSKALRELADKYRAERTHFEDDLERANIQEERA